MQRSSPWIARTPTSQRIGLMDKFFPQLLQVLYDA